MVKKVSAACHTCCLLDLLGPACFSGKQRKMSNMVQSQRDTAELRHVKVNDEYETEEEGSAAW